MYRVFMYPQCDSDKHQDCFANRNGSCNCLSDTNFGRLGCSFYKADKRKKSKTHIATK